MEPMVLFRMGHPPLLILWSALGPPRKEKQFLGDTYTVPVTATVAGPVTISFTNAQIADAIHRFITPVRP
jgi:hypothetical protein